MYVVRWLENSQFMKMREKAVLTQERLKDLEMLEIPILLLPTGVSCLMAGNWESLKVTIWLKMAQVSAGSFPKYVVTMATWIPEREKFKKYI